MPTIGLISRLQARVVVNDVILPEYTDPAFPDRNDRVIRYIESNPDEAFTVVVAIHGTYEYDDTDELDFQVDHEGAHHEGNITAAETEAVPSTVRKIDRGRNANGQTVQFRFGRKDYTVQLNLSARDQASKKQNETGDITVVLCPVRISEGEEGEEKKRVTNASITFRYQTMEALKGLGIVPPTTTSRLAGNQTTGSKGVQRTKKSASSKQGKPYPAHKSQGDPSRQTR